MNSTIARLSQPKRDVLIVGTSTPFPPFELRTGKDIIGFDIDIAKKIANKLQRDLVVQDFSDFDALFPALKTGTIDMVAAGITICDERNEIADFSDPYYQTSQAILVMQGSNFSEKANCTPEDFAGFKIGYQTQTTSEFWVTENIIGKVDVTSCESFNDTQMGLQLLKFKAVDLIIIDKPVAESFARLNQNMEVAGTIETNESYGFVVQEGDLQGLLPVINQILAEMKKNGEYDQLIDQWFGGVSQ